MTTNFSMTAGDHKTLIVDVVDQSGAAVVITGATIAWRAARSLGKSAVISKTTSSGITITDGPGGEFSVTLSPSDTNSLVGNYYHEAQVTLSAGTILTVLTGTMKINKALIVAT